MLYAVIDIGSNSARLMFHNGRKTLYKRVKITALAENMGESKVLTNIAIERTAKVVKDYVDLAKQENADKIYAFATAAVRYAVNKSDFLNRVKELAGVEVEVVSGDVEAELGVMGALNGANGGIIDIGGASTEILVRENFQKTYGKSLDIGVVKIKDFCGQDKYRICDFCKEKIVEYGKIPVANFYGIGGTATTISAMMLELEEYDPEQVDGYRIEINQLKKLVEKLFLMSVEERKALKGLQPERAEVIAGGALLLLLIMEKIGLNYITVSESDNQEGYLMYKVGNL